MFADLITIIINVLYPFCQIQFIKIVYFVVLKEGSHNLHHRQSDYCRIADDLKNKAVTVSISKVLLYTAFLEDISYPCYNHTNRDRQAVIS